MVHVASAMIFTRRIHRRKFQGEINIMKKIASIALGLGLILGLTTATFAADKSTTKSTKTSKKSTKAPKKSTAKM